MKTRLYIYFLCALLVTYAIAEEAEGNVDEAVATCRNAFPSVVRDPSDEGGWAYFREFEPPFLCIYGALPSRLLAGLLSELEHDLAKLVVVVRSTGGPAESWLTLAEKLSGMRIELIVDEACFSSCANYLPIISESVLAVEYSMLVWHGGPGGDDDAELNALSLASVLDVLDFDGLSRRTRDLYDKHGVSIDLLRVSGTQTDEAVLARIFTKLGFEDRQYAIEGYAFSPRTLEECFGLTNATSMWHAGEDEALVQLAQRRSPNLIVLESPKTRDGVRKCKSGPDIPFP